MPPAGPSASWLDRSDVKIVVSLLFRLVNAFSIATFFQPDEYFQSWEIAYEDTFGVGFRSWEWHAGIRTSLVPRLFRKVIQLSQFLGVDHLVVGKIMMALLAALVDVYSSRLAQLVLKRKTNNSTYLARITWLLSLASMFNWHCSTRAFSNTLEVSAVVIGTFYWYAGLDRRSILPIVFAQTLAHIAIALRPSIAIYWILLALDTVFRARTWRSRFKFVGLSLLVALASQATILAADANYYGNFTVPYVEFIAYNFGARISEIYGTHPWHWYLSQGLPLLLLGYIPFVLLGWNRTPWKLRGLVIINVLVFSLISHKEFRFLYYLLPVLHIVAALGFDSTPVYLKALAIVSNIIVAAYFSLFHQRGVVDVVTTIRHSLQIKDVSFLMPCHSTPWHAYFQRHDDPDFKPEFLTCEPPWNVSSANYIDEADQFYMGPIKYLNTHPEKLKNHVVIFEPLEALLTELGYTTTERFYNGLLNEDSRRKGAVLLMKRTAT